MYNFVLVFISPMHIAGTYKNVYQGQQCHVCRTPVSLPSASPCIPNVSISMLKNTSPKQYAPFGLKVHRAYLLLPLFLSSAFRGAFKGITLAEGAALWGENAVSFSGRCMDEECKSTRFPCNFRTHAHFH